MRYRLFAITLHGNLQNAFWHIPFNPPTFVKTIKTFLKMEATSTKKSAVKTVLTIAAGVVIGLAIVKGAEWGLKKVMKKA